MLAAAQAWLLPTALLLLLPHPLLPVRVLLLLLLPLVVCH
jgi:hypothetical protein